MLVSLFPSSGNVGFCGVSMKHPVTTNLIERRCLVVSSTFCSLDCFLLFLPWRGEDLLIPFFAINNSYMNDRLPFPTIVNGGGGYELNWLSGHFRRHPPRDTFLNSSSPPLCAKRYLSLLWIKNGKFRYVLFHGRLPLTYPHLPASSHCPWVPLLFSPNPLILFTSHMTHNCRRATTHPSLLPPKNNDIEPPTF